MKCKHCVQYEAEMQKYKNRCIEQEKRIRELEDKVDFIKYELTQYKTKRYKPKKDDSDDNNDNIIPRKKGGLFGHMGWFRKKPKKYDRIEEVTLDKCPKCGGRDIHEYEKPEEHIQEDIIMPQKETVLYRKHGYYCRDCKEVVRGRGVNELPNSYIGPLAKALAVLLKFKIKVSDRDIQSIFNGIFNLNIAHSSVVGFRNQLKKTALPIYEALIQALRSGKFVHMDETGARIDGDNYWRWKSSNKKVSITYTDPSRGQKVVEAMLGKKYLGVLITDFLSAYNKIITKAKQRCLVHILRDLKHVMEYWCNDDEIIRYCKRLKGIFESAIELYKEYKDKKWDKEYERRREAITEQIKDFSFPNPDKKILKRFAKRLQRHKDELFTFLYIKGIDFHNNHAEQQIRPDVLLRKITFGNRSLNGAKIHDVAMSIIQTAKLNNLDPFKILRKILLTGSKNVFPGVLSSP